MSALMLSGRRVGTASKTMLKNLHAKKELPLNVLVGALGIPMVARSMCKIIVDAGYDTLDKMGAATVEELEAIPMVGSSKAEAFVKGFVERQDIIAGLLDAGLTIKAPATGAMKGMSVCMSGFRDPKMRDAIEEKGGVVKSSVTSKLNILVLKNPASTSGKAKKARAQGTKILGIDEMWEMLGGQ
ncbi:MAG: hypothetical protein HN348_35110 [Proteobacteria bacterium]|nr:hypothetical protein [Pseudomonadota bacterium]